MSKKDKSVPPLSFEIERRARIKHSLVIRAYLIGIARVFTEWLGLLVSRNTQLARR